MINQKYKILAVFFDLNQDKFKLLFKTQRIVRINTVHEWLVNVFMSYLVDTAYPIVDDGASGIVPSVSQSLGN